MEKKEYFRRIPGVDVLLLEFAGDAKRCGNSLVCSAIRRVCDGARIVIQEGSGPEAEEALENLRKNIALEIRRLEENPQKRVINATGILLHTNLGRAPLGERQQRAALGALAGYTSLEYDLSTGERGNRNGRLGELVSLVTGAQTGLAVNNNAAALLLVLSALAAGKEVLVSRGELVEVGGHFRIPDVLSQSGALLREVGTTNRTRLSDYEQAVTENTGAILKVHASNYKILGFTEETGVGELKMLGERFGIPVIVDLGSGALVDLEQFGLCHEPTVQDMEKGGADVICFSGDKLMGGIQAGVIAGEKKYLEKASAHPLMRALRLDKSSMAVLCATLEEYLDERRAVRELPLLKMLARPQDELREQAGRLCRHLRENGFAPECAVRQSAACMGGGSLPLEDIRSWAVVIDTGEMPCEDFKRWLRTLPVPIISCAREQRVWLDMRAVTEEECLEMAEEIESWT